MILRRPFRFFVWNARSFDQQKETATQNSSKWQKRLFHNTTKLFIQFHPRRFIIQNRSAFRSDYSGRLSTRTPLFPAPPSDKKRHFRSAALPSDFPGNTNCRRKSRTRSSRQQQPTAPKPFPAPARAWLLSYQADCHTHYQARPAKSIRHHMQTAPNTSLRETVVKEQYIVCSIPVPLLLNQICFQCCGNTQH